jgi:hypothetical protein
MPVELAIAPEAELDIAEAYVWYEGRRAGLGEEFLSSVDACLESIRRRPEMYPVVHEGYRRSLYVAFHTPCFRSRRRRRSRSTPYFIPLATRTNGASAFPDELHWNPRPPSALAVHVAVLPAPTIDTRYKEAMSVSGAVEVVGTSRE